MLTIKDLKLVELPAGHEVLYGEGDVVARLHLHHPGARLKVGEAVAGGMAHDDPRGGRQHLVHGTRHCGRERERERERGERESE